MDLSLNWKMRELLPRVTPLALPWQTLKATGISTFQETHVQSEFVCVGSLARCIVQSTQLFFLLGTTFASTG